MSSCTVDGCTSPVRARGWCGSHYERWRAYGDPTAGGPKRSVVRGTPEERFWAKVEKTDDCWLWVGFCRGDGYGTFTIRDGDGRRNIGAHRFSYELVNGPIPDGLVIDHLCRNPSCVNPDHLEAVTNRENVLRGEGITARLARQTHCKRGHELSGENVWISNGSRICKTCQRTRTFLNGEATRDRS